MHRIFRVKAYEMEHGPHFNEEHARKAVMKMENEDGTRGPHWSLEETSATILINKEKKPQLSVMRKWLNVSNCQINLKFIMSLLMKIQRQQSFKMK